MSAVDGLSYEILQNWQVRKTKRQKLAFIEMMQSRIPGLRVEEGGLLRFLRVAPEEPQQLVWLVPQYGVDYTVTTSNGLEWVIR